MNAGAARYSPQPFAAENSASASDSPDNEIVRLHQDSSFRVCLPVDGVGRLEVGDVVDRHDTAMPEQVVHQISAAVFMNATGVAT
jgi:hypothetical protein